MRKYQVLIDFVRGPSFGPLTVIACSEDDAKLLAVRESRGFGFDEEVKNIRVEEA